MAVQKVCIIGAGPAGLSMARACQVKGIDYDQFEGHSDVGGIWDITQPDGPMYESAHFISSKTMSGYTGLSMPDHFPDYPSHRQILSYIRDFATQWGLRDAITFNTRVTDLAKTSDGEWDVTLSTGTAQRYSAVVCATGAQWFPLMPDFKGDFDGEIRHSNSYQHADEFRGKRVLVVGAGNSGVDIACDAASNADRAYLSVRRGYYFIPKHICGMPSDVFADSGPHLPLWLQRPIFTLLLRFILGDVSRLGLPKPDHKLMESHPILNSQVLHYLQHGDLQAKPDIDHLDGKGVVFKDGTREEVDLILCATGYSHEQPFGKDYLNYEGGRMKAYLQLFSRKHKNLFTMSYVETNSGAYKLFDLMSFSIANHLADQAAGRPSAQAMEDLIATDEPDLSGGIKFVKSDRHAAYFDSHAWQKFMCKLYKKMGWTRPEDEPGVISPPKPHKIDVAAE